MKKDFLSCVFAFCVVLSFSEAFECGKKTGFTPTIFGGETTSRAEWPWNVALIHKPSNKFFCGGTLVSAKHVLSAAHCFQGKSTRKALLAQHATAWIGKFNLNIDYEVGSISSPVWEIVIHPDWDLNSTSYDADIANVVLEASVTFSEFVQPICLPPFSNDYVSGNGTVVGWGKSENSGSHHHDTTPSKLVVPAIDAHYCYPRYPRLSKSSSRRMFCGGYEDAGKAPCHGDSGGGFYVSISGIDRYWTIRGIVSGSLIHPVTYGCDINKFTLYTNVAMFSDWIGKVVLETMAVEWKFVDFKCGNDDRTGLTTCFTSYDGPVTRNVKIRLDFSSSRKIASADDVERLWIYFKPLGFIPAGVGKAFPKLKHLSFVGGTIEAFQRRDFLDMNQLKELYIRGDLIEFWPEDLLADLPILKELYITGFNVGKFPDNFFANQRELKILSVSRSELMVLQKDLLQNNLKLKYIHLRGNKLTEIAVDFTKFTGIEDIDLRGNECIDKWWKSADESIQSFQDLIIQNCTKT